VKLSRSRWYGISILLLFPWFVATGCDLFNNSLADYFLDNTGVVEVTGVDGRPRIARMENGTVLIPPGSTTLEIALSNPRSLAFRQELLNVPAGKNIQIRQLESTIMELVIEGAVLDDAYDLTLAMQSPDGLRDFAACDLRIRCVSFNTALSDFRVNDVHPFFDPGGYGFTVELPHETTEAVLEGITLEPAAELTLYRSQGSTYPLASGSGRAAAGPVSLEPGENLFYLEVQAWGAVQGYTVNVVRLPDPNKNITEFYFNINGKKYGIGAGTEADSGTISGTDITVTVPHGTDMTSRSASAIYTGASISPAPSTPANYTGPVSYTVTAADGTGQTYTVTVHTFAELSANANLAPFNGIKIGGQIIGGYSPTTYSYGISEPTTSAPAGKTLTLTAGAPGQTIAVSLNGTPVSGGGSYSLFPMTAANSIVITVTAPDGITQKTYAVGYTYYNQTEWYVSAAGNDDNTGLDTASAMATVGAALQAMSDSYGLPTPMWPGKDAYNSVAGRINIVGTINENVTINDSTLPYIILRGINGGTIRAISTGTKRPLTIEDGAKVILDDGLTLTGGNTGTGGGVSVTGSNSEFIMNGGSISNNASSNGGGVYVASNGSFTMNNGTIGGASDSYKNDAYEGGGVYVTGNNSKFIMNGGSISNNTVNNKGGGVNVTGGGSITMNGGAVSWNRASNDCGGVRVDNNSSFILNTGDIIHNHAANGGGVQINGSTFTMRGGSISYNTASSNSGGISANSMTSIDCVINMYGGTISGNSAARDGAGIRLGTTSSRPNSFTMHGGSISGNSITGYYDNGGGVYMADDKTKFVMYDGTISGNSAGALGNGNGVYVSKQGAGGGTFQMESDAHIDQNNDVYLCDSRTIEITGDLTAQPAALITPQTYSTATQVLADSSFLSANYNRFTLTPKEGESWAIGSDGKLVGP
jgi:hypothetical protein